MNSTLSGNGEAHPADGRNESAERGLLMAGNTLAPCIGCALECVPRTCELFTGWLGLLERGPRGPDGHP